MRKKKDKAGQGGSAGKILDTMRNRAEIEVLKRGWLWKGVAAAFAALFLVMLGYNFLLTVRPKNEIPYVVEIDTSNGMQRIRSAVALDDYTYTEQVMINTVRKYVTDLRTVGTDNLDNAERVSEVFAHTAKDAVSFVRSFYQENNPNERNKEERVVVVVYNAMPIKSAGLKFQVDWNETVYNKSSGRIVSEKNYRADIDARQYKATKDTRERNPLGFYITYIYISEIKDGYVVKNSD